MWFRHYGWNIHLNFSRDASSRHCWCRCLMPKIWLSCVRRMKLCAFATHLMANSPKTMMIHVRFLDKKIIFFCIRINSLENLSHALPRCDLNFVCLTDFAEHSLSDSDPNVSYSVMGMWSERILRTSESVEPGLSDSRNCMSCASSRSRVPVRRTLVYSGSLDCNSEQRSQLI